MLGRLLWCARLGAGLQPSSRQGLPRLYAERMSSLADSRLVKELPYEGMMLDLCSEEVGGLHSGLPSESAFESQLTNTVESWRESGKLSAWLTLPLSLLHYGRAAAKFGFVAHHAPASGDRIVLYKWLRDDAEDKVPPYAPATQVGCAGFVVNSKGELLVVKEWRTVDGARVPSSQWKLPGGLSDPGESLLECAARETFEETGVDCVPVGVLSMWHRHNVGPFHKSDIYCVVRLEPRSSDEIVIDSAEISDARWYDMQEFVRQEDHPLVTRILREMYDDGRGFAGCELVDLGVKWPNRPRYPTYFPTKTTRLISSITTVASDVDGTLLRSDSTLHPANAKAIDQLKDAGLRFFIATGKCRQGARNSLNMPDLLGGVYCNGLVVYDEDGTIVADKRLDEDAVDEVVQIAQANGFDVVAYSGDRLACLAETDRVLELATRYCEPKPELVAAFQKVNKLLLLGDPKLIATSRPGVEARVAGKAAVTMALPDMLEILPFGQSKRQGVLAYCQHHGIEESTQLFAVGDGENDMEMLRHAAVGVAMANAAGIVARAADVTIDKTNDQAGAAAAFQLAQALSSAHSLD